MNALFSVVLQPAGLAWLVASAVLALAALLLSSRSFKGARYLATVSKSRAKLLTTFLD